MMVPELQCHIQQKAGGRYPSIPADTLNVYVCVCIYIFLLKYTNKCTVLW